MSKEYIASWNNYREATTSYGLPPCNYDTYVDMINDAVNKISNKETGAYVICSIGDMYVKVKKKSINTLVVNFFDKETYHNVIKPYKEDI